MRYGRLNNKIIKALKIIFLELSFLRINGEIIRVPNTIEDATKGDE